MFLLTPEFFIAVSAIVLHVANYNITAQIEYYTHIFTKVYYFFKTNLLELFTVRYLTDTRQKCSLLLCSLFSY